VINRKEQEPTESYLDVGRQGAVNQLTRICILLTKVYIYRFLMATELQKIPTMQTMLSDIKRAVFGGLRFCFNDFRTPGKNERGETMQPLLDEAAQDACETMRLICQSLIEELGGSVTESLAATTFSIYYAFQPDQVNGPPHIAKVHFKYITECFFASTRLDYEGFVVVGADAH
jgi:hypothetical protein